MKKQIFYFLFAVTLTSILNSCNKDSNNDILELKQLGVDNFTPSAAGIRGFNNAGAPIVHHQLDILYEYDEANNSFTKLGNTIPNPAQISSSKIVQDALGNYFYHSGFQGQVYMLNETTQEWDTVEIATGYKNQMIANANGDILVYINNTTIGGIESFYKKESSSNTWVKVIDVTSINSSQMAPQFMNNAGLVFFSTSTGPSNKIDGEGFYNDVVLNTNTATFQTLYDKTDPENFPALQAYLYTGFNSYYTSPDGTFYTLVTSETGTKTSLYTINSSVLPAKFVKVTEYYHPPLHEGSYIVMRGCKINEATGEVKFRSSCQIGQYSHKNLGVSSTKSSELNVLEHDGAQNDLFSNQFGTVYVHNYQSNLLYMWK